LQRFGEDRAHGTSWALSWRRMRAILLSDSAEVREGLLFLLGGGWNISGP
jgi:hypothetical protein